METGFPLGTGKLFGAYLFLGSCISLMFVASMEDLSEFKTSDLLFLILTMGSLIGSIISTTQFHKVFKFAYGFGSLSKTLENDYQSFRDRRDTFYFRSIFLFSLFILIFIVRAFPTWNYSLKNVIKQFYGATFDPLPFCLGINLLFIISIYLWLRTWYSNRDQLLLFRYVIATSNDNMGIDKTAENVQKFEKELREGNWGEAKAQFQYILESCNKILKDLDLRRTGTTDLQKYGFIFLDYKNQEQNRKIQEVVKQIRSFEWLKTPSIQDSTKNNKDLTKRVREKEKELEILLLDWKIKDWNSFVYENLFFPFNSNCYYISKIFKKLVSSFPYRKK